LTWKSLYISGPWQEAKNLGFFFFGVVIVTNGHFIPLKKTTQQSLALKLGHAHQSPIGEVNFFEFFKTF
jgi:hypothetical protein